MRTHILIATAIILSATAAHAAPRSLSGAQDNAVEAPAQKVQILEAPEPKVQILEAPQAIEQPKEQSTAAEQATPVDTAPVRAAPVEERPVISSPVETKPVEAKPVEAKVEARPAEAIRAPEAKPVQQARRKQPHRRATVEQRIDRDIRTIERTIHRHIGFALSTAALYYW